MATMSNSVPPIVSSSMWGRRRPTNKYFYKWIDGKYHVPITNGYFTLNLEAITLCKEPLKDWPEEIKIEWKRARTITQYGYRL